ncbi:AzlD family protein [Ancylobacter sp. TS-1]|uniref:AzlD family protein n=1 Tax=Ancylobacter sp. TS-1 TaxID=1850374 RepID=UPI001265C34C|nr:AzlD domain-containing protein [Ancylobacter sp. TS-1]QFR32823.1 AzlD domain-containing protein [Ancylobacter sp. TS-1]
MSTANALLVVFAMALVTYATRAGGIFLVGFMPMSARMESFLRYLAGSVLVALVVPATVRGGAEAYVAVGVAVLGMLALRRALPAIALGILAAALWRAYMGAS